MEADPRRRGGLKGDGMVRLWGLTAVLALAACVEAGGEVPRDAGVARIEIFSGGSFSGSSTVTVYVDDKIVTATSGPFGEGAARHAALGRPGLYAEMVAFAAKEGPKVAQRQRRTLVACEDYGTDGVRLDPAVGGFEGLSASCPDPAVTGFIDRLRAMIPAR